MLRNFNTHQLELINCSSPFQIYVYMLLRLRSQTCKSICNQFCILHVEVDILDKKKELKISVNFIYMVNGNTFVYNPFALHIEVNPMQAVC